MSDSLALSLSQFERAWQTLCAAAPGHVMASQPGMELLFSRLPIPFFNVAILTERLGSAAALRARAAEASAFATRQGVPWFLVVTHDLLAPGVDPVAALDEQGLTPMVNLTGMFAETLTPALPAPERLEIVRAGDEATSAAMMNVNSAAYGVDLQAGMDAVGSPAFWQNHFGAVGRVDGTPVACSGVMIVDGHRYVAFVATHPDHQRRGYADAVMRRSLDLAAAEAGPCPTVLHATDAGRPVYVRMGYAPISSHTLYIPREFAEGH